MTRSLGRQVGGVALVTWFGLPGVPLLLWSITQRWPAPDVLPQQLGLRGWQGLIDAGLVGAVARSSAIGLAVAAIAVPLGALAGRALAWHRVRLANVTATVLMLPVALPPFAIALGTATVVLRLRVPATAAVVTLLAVFALPYTTLLLRAAYAAVDPDLERQARMLGAGRTRAILTTTVPSLRPALLAAAGIAFLVGWSDYVTTLVVGGGAVVTLPMLLASAMSGSGNEPVVAAAALTMLLPAVVLVVGIGVSGGLSRTSTRQVSP